MLCNTQMGRQVGLCLAPISTISVSDKLRPRSRCVSTLYPTAKVRSVGPKPHVDVVWNVIPDRVLWTVTETCKHPVAHTNVCTPPLTIKVRTVTGNEEFRYVLTNAGTTATHAATVGQYGALTCGHNKYDHLQTTAERRDPICSVNEAKENDLGMNLAWERHCCFDNTRILLILSTSLVFLWVMGQSVVGVSVLQRCRYVWWTSWNMSSRGMGVSAPYTLEARRSKADTICFTTSSKKTWASCEWMRERNSKEIWGGNRGGRGHELYVNVRDVWERERQRESKSDRD